MSWTDYFPLLTDELVAEYESGATADEKAAYGHHFAIGSVHNRRPAEHILSSSLFWKAARPNEPELPPLTREVLMNPGAFGIIARVGNPWEHYVEPILHAARNLRDERPDVTVRIHLAADLAFLLDELCEAGCEVMLMESSSLRHNPGAM